jgi:hypothetical protein
MSTSFLICESASPHKPASRTQRLMSVAARGNAIFALMVFGACATPALGATVAYVSLPTGITTGSSSISPGTTYTTNLGYAFKTGSSGTFEIDWIKLELQSGATSGSGSFKIWINGTDNDTPYLAVASSTVHAADTVNFTTPATANTPFELVLSSADLTNISAFSLQPNTAYSLFVNSASGSGIALRRVQGLAAGTANDQYDVTNGFTMLDTFRNNTPNYATIQGSPVSHAVFGISFGTTAAIPEPSALALFSIFVGGGLLRRHRAKS